MALVAAIVTNVAPKDLSAQISASHDMSLSADLRLSHLQRVYFAHGADASVWLKGWWPEVTTARRRAAKQTIDKDWIRIADRHPTLYVAAQEGVISPPSDLDSLRSTLGPNTACVVVKNAGHALLPEQPDILAQTLPDWIADLGQGNV